MIGNEIHYFTCGNTAKGFKALLDTNVAGLDKLYILRGGLAAEKTEWMKQIGALWQQSGQDVEYLRCALDQNALDGVIAPGFSCGVISAELPHTMAAAGETIECGVVNARALDERLDRVGQLYQAITTNMSDAYACFAAALRIHDGWETIYISAMDKAAHSKATAKLIQDILSDKERQKAAEVKHRFLGGATPAGPMDCIPSLTKGLQRRVFLKGRPGTGKSTLLKQLASAAQNKGFDTEIYHCGFDPDSLDMVILRELGTAVIDTTAPHEYFPNEESDEIFDLYEKIIAPGTDEANADLLQEIASAYKAKIQEGTAHLAKLKTARGRLERILESAISPLDRQKARDILFASCTGLVEPD